MTQMKEQIKLQKKTKQNGDKQSIRCRVQNTRHKDAQGTYWVLQQHKKDSHKNEDYIKQNTNLQGTKSGGDEAKNHINNLDHKEEKKHSIKTGRKKKN